MISARRIEESDDQEAIIVNGAYGTAVAAARQPVAASESEGAADAREKRIAELRRKYVEGRYRVDAAQVSASIIDDHLED